MMNEWILSASLLIAAVLAGRFLLRGKISLRLQYGLWLVVLLRLLLPVQLFTSSYGAGSIARDVDISAPVRQVYTSAREDSYEREYDEAYQRVVDEYEARNQPYAPADAELEAQAIARESLELDLTKLIYTVWFAGMAVMTAVIISCNVHLSLQLRRRRYEFPAPDCLLPVYVTEAVPTPCLFGIFHPAIYMTPEAAGDEQVRRHVLTHELTHYRHWDHIWSVLRSFCLVLHWYNPLVWAAAKVSRADAELACDEGALARLGEDHRADYGRTLIGLTCGERIGSVLLNATTMTGSAGSIRERIKLLMKRPRNTVLALTALVLIGTMVVGCSFAGAPETVEPVTEQIDQDGVLVYPGTEWNMTMDELKAALEIAPDDIIDEQKRTYDEPIDDRIYGSADLDVQHTFLGYPAQVSFMFHSYTPDSEPGLYQIYVELGDVVEVEVLKEELTEELGAASEGALASEWASSKTIGDLVDQQTYDRFLRVAKRNISYDCRVSRLNLSNIAYDYHGTLVVFWSDLPFVLQCGGATNFDIAYFEDLLDPDLYRSEADWYPRALTSCYADPAKIDLFQLFYGGIPGADNTPSTEELAFLENAPGYEPEFDLVRIPASEIDRVLTEYFGITLAQTDRIGLDYFLYNEAADCYYHSHTDTNLRFCKVTHCEEVEENVWRVWYTPDDGASCIVTLRYTGGGWQVLSNQTEGHTPTPDMSDHSEQLPIPDDPGAIVNADGLIVFPGTEWNMTEAELLKALDIQEYGIFSGMRGFHIPEMTVFDHPAEVCFYFDNYTGNAEWGLSSVTIHFQSEEDAGAVRDRIIEELGSADAWTSGVAFEVWRSDVRLEDLVSPEAYAKFQETIQDNLFFDGEASSVSWYGPGNPNYENVIRFESGIPRVLQIEESLGGDQAAEVAALFGEGADPWYLSALTVLYPAPYDFDAQAFFCNGQTSVALTGQEKGILTDAYGKVVLEKPLFRMTEERMDNILQQYIGIGAWDVDLSGFLFCPETGAYLKVKDSVGDLPVPEIISCETLAENQVRMIYTLPGREQRYAATLLKGENWKVYSNQMVISKPLAAGTRALTEAEIEQVGDAFQPVIEDEALGESYANPLACMVNDFYDDVTQMDRSAFLRNFPYEEAGTEEDFQLLKKKYPDVFENEETIRDMPVPIHRYDPKTLNETLGRYADIRWEDLPWDEELHYLEETGCFYNYFSDFSVRGFHCTGGWVYDGGATLCSNESVLILTERNGEYFIQAHLPAIVG